MRQRRAAACRSCLCRGALAQLFDFRARILGGKNRVASDEGVGPRFPDRSDRLAIDAAIDFEKRVAAILTEHVPSAMYLYARAFDELLPAYAGVYGHDLD